MKMPATAETAMQIFEGLSIQGLSTKLYQCFLRLIFFTEDDLWRWSSLS